MAKLSQEETMEIVFIPIGFWWNVWETKILNTWQHFLSRTEVNTGSGEIVLSTDNLPWAFFFPFLIIAFWFIYFRSCDYPVEQSYYKISHKNFSNGWLCVPPSFAEIWWRWRCIGTKRSGVIGTMLSLQSVPLVSLQTVPRFQFCCRVSGGNFTHPSLGTMLDSLPSQGSSHLTLLFISLYSLLT